MTAFISLKKDYGTTNYHEVGTTHRKVVRASSIKGIHKMAHVYAQGKDYRAEIYFDNHLIYGEPNIIDYVQQQS